MGVLLLGTITRKNVTTDELIHIPAGYQHLRFGNFRVNVEHPPLAKMWAALPLLAIGPSARQLPSYDSDLPEESNPVSLQSFWHDNHSRFDAISYWSRIPMVLLTLALGALTFSFARQVCSDRVAVLAVLLFAMEPTVLAHGRVVHTDVPAALTYLGFWMALYRYVNNPGVSSASVLGLSLGLGLATKFSMVPILVPVALVALSVVAWRASAARHRWRVAAQALVVALVALLVINAAYRFQHPALTPAEVRMIEIGSPRLAPVIVPAMAALSTIVPTGFLLGLYIVAAHDYYGHPASVFGRYSTHGWWWYFPAAFALKSSIPFLLLTIASIAWTSWMAVQRHEKTLVLFVPAILYVGLCMKAGINIGVRHLLPAYPFLFIIGGALLDRLLASGPLSTIRRSVAVLILGWALLEIVHAYPSYMPYMNQLASGRPPWEYLSDSNVEWGDDVKSLAEYLRARGESRVLAALFSGSVLARYGVEYVDLFGSPPVGTPIRYAAIGASFLNGSTTFVGNRQAASASVDFFGEYRKRKPDAVVGGSIYIYRLQ